MGGAALLRKCAISLGLIEPKASTSYTIRVYSLMCALRRERMKTANTWPTTGYTPASISKDLATDE